MKIEFCVGGKKVVIESAGAVSVQVYDEKEAATGRPEEAREAATMPPEPESEPMAEMESATPEEVQENAEDAAVAGEEDLPEPASSGDLFLDLSCLRRQIAAEQKVPPYVVFKDSTLLEMARKRPQDLEELRGISGVGAAKLERYGNRFLSVIKGAAA